MLLAAAILARCAGTAPTPPAVTPQGDDRYLIDPRAGYGALDPVNDRKFESAWRFALAGNETEARRLLDELRRKNPNYTPAALAEVAIEIQAGRLDAAKAQIERLKRGGGSIALSVYEAEI